MVKGPVLVPVDRMTKAVLVNVAYDAYPTSRCC
jgi:hypothetical protein